MGMVFLIAIGGMLILATMMYKFSEYEHKKRKITVPQESTSWRGILSTLLFETIIIVKILLAGLFLLFLMELPWLLEHYHII